MHWAMDADADHPLIVPWRLSSDDSRAGELAVPIESHVMMRYEAGIFFMCWIFVGCFLVVNMTIGVVVDTFAHLKQANDGVILMTMTQQEWVRTQKQAFTMRPLIRAKEPTAQWRKGMYALVVGDKFEVFIMGVILLNMLQMGLDWWEPYSNAPYMPQLKDAHKYINVAFFAVYVIEMTLKMIGLGLFQYFKDMWNCFDFVLVGVSCFDITTTFLDSRYLPFPPSVIRMLRLVRVVRILRIIKSAKNMRTIMMTVFISLPQLKNIIILVLLLVVIFDMMCINLFYRVNYTPGMFDLSTDHTYSEARGEVYDPDDYHYSDDGTNWGDQINRHANFQFVWTGMITLIRSSTGESFNLIMHDVYGYEWGHNRLTCCPQCGPIVDGQGPNIPELTVPSTGRTMLDRVVPETSCGQSFWAIIIYLFFQLIMAYIVLSIMIGVILENFNSIGSSHQRVSIDDIESFREVWRLYDPTGTFSTATHNILAIISQLEPPLGVKGVSPPPTRSDLLRVVQRLNLPDHNGMIHFNETLTHLSKVAQERGRGEVRLPDVDAVRKIAKLSSNLPGFKALDGATHNTYTNYVLALLQARFRAYHARVEAQEASPEELSKNAGKGTMRSKMTSKLVGSAGKMAKAAKGATSKAIEGAKQTAQMAPNPLRTLAGSKGDSNSSGENANMPMARALVDGSGPDAAVTVRGVVMVRQASASPIVSAQSPTGRGAE